MITERVSSTKTAHDEKHDLVPGHYRDNAQRSAQCQRADIAHKNMAG